MAPGRGRLTAPGPQPADYIGGRIQRVTFDGEVTDLDTHAGEHALRGPNDLVFDADGGFWFTGTGKTRARETDLGGLYHAQADGSGIVEAVYPLQAPNGVNLSPDGTRVYVAETITGRLWAWDLAGPGAVARDPASTARHGGTLVHGFPGWQWLDSRAVDADGNICFGGPDLRTAYVTSSGLGVLYAAEWARPGLPLRHGA